MYEGFFGFNRRPFSLTPDPDFLFWTDQHRQAFDRVCMSLLRNAPVALVTGEVGAGKTTLIQELLREISGEFEVALLSNVVGDSGDLLRWILTAFGQDAEPSTRAEALRAVERFLGGVAAEGRRSVLIVDEAQNVSDNGIETLRLLTNLDVGKAAPLSLVLTGQPQLRDRLRGDRFKAFRQRLGASFHLGPMTLTETTGYVRSRLNVAGGDSGIFEPGAIEAVHRRAMGIPRLTNLLCDVCLVSAYAEDRLRVDADFAEAALAETLAIGGLGGLAAEAAAMDGAVKQATAAARSGVVPRFRVADPAGPSASPPPLGAGGMPQRPSAPPSLRVVGGDVPPPSEAEVVPLRPDASRPPEPLRLEESRPRFASGSAPTPLRSRQRPGFAWRRALGSVAGAAVAAGLAGAVLILPATWTDAGQAVSAVATLLVVSDDGQETRELTRQAVLAATPAGDTSLGIGEARLAQPDPQGAELLFRQALERAASDPAAAAVDYSRAAARGHDRAAYYLAQMYETGDGVMFAPDTAWTWYAAAAGEVPGAEERLTELATYPAPEVGYVNPLFSDSAGGVIELAWEGRGSFVVELAAAPGEGPDAVHSTPLTAVRLEIPGQMGWWRVRPVGGQQTEWRPL